MPDTDTFEGQIYADVHGAEAVFARRRHTLRAEDPRASRRRTKHGLGAWPDSLGETWSFYRYASGAGTATEDDGTYYRRYATAGYRIVEVETVPLQLLGGGGSIFGFTTDVPR